MAAVDTWLSEVADARARGDTHAVKWLTACWAPYPPAMRQAAKDGIAKASASEPVDTGPVESVSVGPPKTGKIVFHPSAVRRPSVDSTPTE